MSASSLQKKIDAAHKKVSIKLGYTYALYRPIQNNDVLDDANFIDDLKLAVTVNDSYMATLGWEIPVWTAYTDAKMIQLGDFLYSEDQGRCFFVFSRQPHLPVLMLEVNDRCDIKSVGYANDGTGYSSETATYVARNLPCYTNYGTRTTSGGIPARSNAVSGMRSTVLITTLPKQKMAMGLSVELPDGFKGDIISYDYSAVGVGLRVTAQEFVNA